MAVSNSHSFNSIFWAPWIKHWVVRIKGMSREDLVSTFERSAVLTVLLHSLPAGESHMALLCPAISSAGVKTAHPALLPSLCFTQSLGQQSPLCPTRVVAFYFYVDQVPLKWTAIQGTPQLNYTWNSVIPRNGDSRLSVCTSSALRMTWGFTST